VATFAGRALSLEICKFQAGLVSEKPLDFDVYGAAPLNRPGVTAVKKIFIL
jgi:hypothetical protein